VQTRQWLIERFPIFQYGIHEPSGILTAVNFYNLGTQFSVITKKLMQNSCSMTEIRPKMKSNTVVAATLN